MQRLPFTIYAMLQTSTKARQLPVPKTSIPIRNGAITVFVALPKTAAYPSAPHKTGEIPNKFPRQYPSVAPIENNGVTSPP